MQRLLGDIANEVGLLHPSFQERLRALARESRYRDRALELVRDMERAGRVWFWKDPLLSLLVPFWREILDELVFVVAVRNPYESALSWELFSLPPGLPKGFRTLAANLLRWQHYTRSILEATAGSPTIFVLNERLLDSPLEQCRRLAAFLDEHCGPVAGEPGTADPEERMAQVIDPSLRRVRQPVPFDEVPEATPEQKALYRLMLRKVDAPEAEFDLDLYPLYAGWKEYLQNLALMSHMLTEATPLLNSRAASLALTLTSPWRLFRQRWARRQEGPPKPARSDGPA
jgi:hypothetical protein